MLYSYFAQCTQQCCHCKQSHVYWHPCASQDVVKLFIVLMWPQEAPPCLWLPWWYFQSYWSDWTSKFKIFQLWIQFIEKQVSVFFNWGKICGALMIIYQLIPNYSGVTGWCQRKSQIMSERSNSSARLGGWACCGHYFLFTGFKYPHVGL